MKALLAALLLALLAAVPANAATSATTPQGVYNKVVNAANPEATYNALTKAQKDALLVYLTPVRTTITPMRDSDLTQLAVGCKEVGHTVAKYNIIGVLAWTWNLYAEVCYDGSRITYSSARHYGITYLAFWSWRTESAYKSINTILNPDRLTVYGQAEFKLCVFSNIGCVQFAYPFNELRFNANGTHSWRWGG